MCAEVRKIGYPWGGLDYKIYMGPKLLEEDVSLMTLPSVKGEDGALEYEFRLEVDGE